MLDAVVVGAGPAGLLAGLAIADTGLDVAVCGIVPTVATGQRDTRTAALLGPSITLLEALNVWQFVRRSSAPITAIRLVDNMGRLARAPEVLFDAAAIGRDRLGWNIPNDALVNAAIAAADAAQNCELLLGVRVERISQETVGFAVHLDDGRAVRARLLVAADGQRSTLRGELGIGARRWAYPQAALTTAFAHSRPHADISTEFHRAGGPFTVVPLPGPWSSLVWVDTQESIAELERGTAAILRAAIEAQLQGLLGLVEEPLPPRVFPLGGLVAERFGCGAAVLIGEAAHAFPPIGAQGLNLTCRDVAVLADCIAGLRAEGGSAAEFTKLGVAYDRRRRQDVLSRVWAVDGLNRSLTSVWPMMGWARGAVLHTLNASAAVRRGLMQVGLAESGDLPPLMRQR